MGPQPARFRTFNCINHIDSIASFAITGIVYRSNVTDHGLHAIAVILVTVGAVVLVMTLVDRRLKTTRLDPCSSNETEQHRRTNKETHARQAPTIDPQHTVLLVMDYQPAILSSLLEADVLLSRLAGAIATVRDHGGQVGYVQVAFDETDYAAIPATNKHSLR